MQNPVPQRRPEADAARRAELRVTPPQGVKRRKRRRKAKRQQQITLVVMAVMVLGMLVVALLVTREKEPAPAPDSSAGTASMPSVAASAAQSTPASLPVPQLPDRIPTQYDLEGVPPLFNYQNFIPASYSDGLEAKLIDVGGSQKMEPAAGKAFIAMREAAAADGIDLVPVSGYRTNQRQTNNYNASIQRYVDQGYSKEKAIELTEGYYAIPGTSEHEAGLAMDIGMIDDSFENTEAFRWLQAHCAEYGFIMRYAADTFDITRINYEPWHYRYVGANHAERIQELGVTLEEYVEMLDGMG